MKWQVKYRDGQILSEAEVAYLALDFSQIEWLCLISSLGNRLEINIPPGARPFFRKRNHLEMTVNGKREPRVVKVEYLAGYRHKIDGNIYTMALLISGAKMQILTEADVEWLPQERLESECNDV